MKEKNAEEVSHGIASLFHLYLLNIHEFPTLPHTNTTQYVDDIAVKLLVTRILIFLYRRISMETSKVVYVRNQRTVIVIGIRTQIIIPDKS